MMNDFDKIIARAERIVKTQKYVKEKTGICLDIGDANLVEQLIEVPKED